MSEGVDFIDRQLARLASWVEQMKAVEVRNCVHCGDGLPQRSTSRRKYCNDLCRAAHNEPARPARDQSGRREYNTNYQRNRRRAAKAAGKKES